MNGGGSLEKAELVPHGPDRGPGLKLHYNPATLTLRTGATWNKRSGKNVPAHLPPEFQGAKPITYVMDVVLDGTEGADVPSALQQLVRWTRSSARSRQADRPSPPLLMLEWGGMRWGPLHIDKLKVDHTLFDTNGTPLRAKVNLRMTEHTIEPIRTNPTSGGPSGRRQALVTGADDLAAVAQREYGDPALWRAVAAANGIDDPARVARGTALMLPPVNDARELLRGDRA